MKIAQVAPLYESVPPKLYGGTERVVSWLTEELVRLGHDVTLFASGDSLTGAKLVPVCREALRLDSSCIDQLAHHVVMVEQVFKERGDFHLIHFHIDYLHFPVSRREPARGLTTLHGRLDIPDLVPLYRTFPEMPVVSISDAQREPLPGSTGREPYITDCRAIITDSTQIRENTSLFWDARRRKKVLTAPSKLRNG